MRIATRLLTIIFFIGTLITTPGVIMSQPSITLDAKIKTAVDYVLGEIVPK